MKTANIDRMDVVALAKEFNAILSITIDVTKKATVENIIAEMQKQLVTLSPADFEPAEEGEFTFSESAKETFIALGFTLPKAPEVPTKTVEELMKELADVKEQLATAKKTGKKSAGVTKYTRQTAFVDALKAGSGTKEELVERAHKLYIAKNPNSAEESSSKHHKYFVAEVQFRYVMQCFVLYGIVEYNADTKIYSEIVETENDETETASTSHESEKTE